MAKKRLDIAAARLGAATGVPTIQKRTRSVGRHQRVVSWVSVEKLIVPDWQTIQVRSVADRLGDT